MIDLLFFIFLLVLFLQAIVHILKDKYVYPHYYAFKTSHGVLSIVVVFLTSIGFGYTFMGWLQ